MEETKELPLTATTTSTPAAGPIPSRKFLSFSSAFSIKSGWDHPKNGSLYTNDSTITGAAANRGSQSVISFPPSKVTSFAWRNVSFYYPQKHKQPISRLIFTSQPSELPLHQNEPPKPAIDGVSLASYQD